MLRFSLFGIPVTIQWPFWLIAAFLGNGMTAIQVGEPLLIQHTLLFMAAVFLSIMVHEFGHAFAGLRFGAPRTSVELNGMGGLASFPSAPFSRREHIMVSAAGPAAGFAFAALAVVASYSMYGSLIPGGKEFVLTTPTHGYMVIKDPVRDLIQILVTINLLWSVVNLLPIFPLDGGQIMRDVLGPSKMRLTCIISLVLIVILAGVAWVLTKSIYNLLILGYLGMHNWQMLQRSNRF